MRSGHPAARRGASLVFAVNSPEVFYLHIGGEQRGPYTIAHIDHLLNSGLIAEETLFWREGLEQWQPVTTLVRLRRPARRRWVRLGVIAGVLVVLALLSRVFWPPIVEGWREVDQRDFTAEAAYWRARDMVRNQGAPKGALVGFAGVDAAKVELLPPPLSRASVRLQGDLAASRTKTRRATWEVILRYNPEAKEWTGVSVKEVPSGT